MDWPDFAAIIIATGSLTWSVISTYRQEQRLKKANKKAKRALRISHGSLEISIRNAISEARYKVLLASKDLKIFRTGNPKADYSVFEKIFYACVEDLFNQYERACMLYLDKKIDRKRFKSEYSNELKNLVENENYQKRFFPHGKERFPYLIKVYQKVCERNEVL